MKLHKHSNKTKPGVRCTQSQKLVAQRCNERKYNHLQPVLEAC